MKSNTPSPAPPPARTGLSNATLLIGAVLWTAVFASGIFVWKSRSEAIEAAQASEAQADKPGADEIVKPGEQKASVKLSFPAKRLPDFEFDKATGGTLSLDDLKGKRWVASFVFSRCTTSCPVITAAVMRLHDRVEKSAPDVMFVSFTVDPKYDTADVFREYSETFTKGNRDRWKFLTGSQQQIYELIVKGFGLYVKENLGESRLPGLEVAHSNRVVLVNEDGIPVGTFLGTNEGDMAKLRRILSGREEFPQPGPASSPGLTFSRTDGGPMDIQFQVQPVKSNDESEADDSPSPTDESADAPSVDATTEESTSDVEQSGAAPPAGSSNGDDDACEDKSTSAVDHNAIIDQKLPAWARPLPTVNASLNTLAGILLLCGLAAIKSGHKTIHRNLMITAFLTSAAFLASYLTYHYALGEYTGEHGKRFTGAGVWAIVYQLVLWPHIILAMFVPFLAIAVFRHAFAERWDAHKRLARITFPIWMYVSVTGVVIYGMLYHWPWPAPAEV